MAFDWIDFFAYGEDLCRNGAQEAHWRTAVSRLYYSAFHKAKEYAIRNGYSDPKDHAHHQLGNWYDGKPDLIFKTAGSTLHRLLQMRKAADYNGDFFGG